MIRRLLDLLRRPAVPTQPTGYRAEPPVTPREALFDLEAQFSAQRHRIRTLERQLRQQGIEPAPTPDGRELLDVADVLDRCARGELSRRSVSELRHLAALVRGLGTWRE